MSASISRLLLSACLVIFSPLAYAGGPEKIPAFDMQRCVNMGNSLENAKVNGWGGGPNISPEDFQRIKSKGFDTVRIPVRWNDYTRGEPDYKIEPEFLALVKSIVDSALDNDLNVILNIHHFHEIMEDPDNEMLKFVYLWIQIGEAFKDYPDDLWFETLNEPSLKLTGDKMRLSQKLAIDTIRDTNPERVIILGGEFWSNFRQLDSNMAPPDDNIVYTFHYYEPFDFTHYLAEWTKPNMPDKLRSWGSRQDKTDLKNAVADVVSYREKIDRPVFLGEFGVYTSITPKDRVKWLRAVRTDMENADIPWCLWAYANTFPVFNPDKDAWDDDVIKALGLD